jgi:hypothetical protein
LAALLSGTLTGDTHEAEDYRTYPRLHNSAMGFASMSTVIKLPPGNVPDCLWMHGQIHPLVLPLKPGYGQFYTSDHGQATRKWL